jgi:hypothetical protein
VAAIAADAMKFLIIEGGVDRHGKAPFGRTGFFPLHYTKRRAQNQVFSDFFVFFEKSFPNLLQF